MAIDDGVRAIEDGVQTDFTARMDYGSYLSLDTLLSAPYSVVNGPLAARYAIVLDQLPPARVAWSVDGVLVPHPTIFLRKDARVTVISREDRPVGVLLVPAGVRTLATAPAEEFQF